MILLATKWWWVLPEAALGPATGWSSEGDETEVALPVALCWN